MSLGKYTNRIYSGVLGKMIGVYLGRPIEGWSYPAIQDHFGDINYYIHDKVGVPLIVSDDDISGTFVFLRALEDNGYPAAIDSKTIGNTWLNYIIEEKTILWWGGLGRSTEHTAFLRLKNGIEAPRSGSIEVNGTTVAEGIGAQIFIDSWAMVNPGDPDRAAAMAREAARVSHDGLAVDAACLLAAVEAQAFEERDLDKLLDLGVSYVTNKHLLAMIDHVRNQCEIHSDWRDVREWLGDNYGYDKYPGPCHMVPNHGLIIMALLYGGDDFQKSIMIATSAGWDTDCNAGNVGCLNGIRLGLEGIDAGPDFRKPVADFMYVVNADGGSCVTDAVLETRKIVRAAEVLHGSRPGDGNTGTSADTTIDLPRYGFEYPGSVQGFVPCPYYTEAQAVYEVGNLNEETNENGLVINYKALAKGRAGVVSTPTFVDFSTGHQHYNTPASPILYSSQTVTAVVKTFDETNPSLQFYVLYFDREDKPQRLESPVHTLEKGENLLDWRLPNTDGLPIFRLGVKLTADRRLDGKVALLRMNWAGAPIDFSIGGPVISADRKLSKYLLHSWVSSAKHLSPDFTTMLCVSHPEENGVVTIGTRDWNDYSAASGLLFTVHKAGGLVIRSRGHRRYYAALLRNGSKAAIIKRKDGDVRVLAEVSFSYRQDERIDMKMTAEGDTLTLSVNGKTLAAARDDEYTSGAAGFIIEEGTMLVDGLRIVTP